MAAFDNSKMKDEIYLMIREGLMDAVKAKNTRNETNTQELRIKMEYLGEKRSLLIRRPISFRALSAKIDEMYGRSLTMYYTVSNSEIIIAIQSQQELNSAVDLVDKCSHMRSLRLLLSKHAEITNNEEEKRKKNDAFPDIGRFSPPPGFGSGSHLRSLDEGSALEVPYISTSSSRASSRMSTDAGNIHLPKLRSGRSIQQNSGSTGRHGSFGSSTSSGVLADMETTDGRRLSAKSPICPTNWRQGRCLGSGSFGQVFLCYDADTGRELAVKKVIVRGVESGPKILNKQIVSLENEITLLKNMQHERIVQYFGFHRGDDFVCIFMEYMAGGSIKDVLRQWGPLTSKLARKYTKQICEGLMYLHHYDIVHRDIKPSNILRDSEGNVKIGDFGSGKRLQTICSQNGANTFIGTSYYMAPEVIQGQRYGRKADIWSVGCSLVEMLSGHPPWKDLEPMAAIFRIAFEPPQYELSDSVEPDLEQLLNWLFTRNPEKRPHASQLIQHSSLNN